MLRNGDHETVPVASAGGAYTQGDIVTVGDGRIGVVTGLEAVASGDPTSLRVYGQFDILKNATSDTYAVGVAVWFDPTAKVAKTAYATGYYYAGRCVKTSASGDVYVYTDLNVAGSANTQLPPISVTAATVTIDSTYYNRLIVLNAAAGVAVTLPAATGTGARLRFWIGTTITSNTTTIAKAGSDAIKGLIFQLKNGAAVAVYTSTSGATITMDGSTKGGIIGDVVELVDAASGVWLLNGTLSASGTVANPIS